MDDEHVDEQHAPTGHDDRAAPGQATRNRRLPGRAWMWWTGGALALTGAAYCGAAVATAGEVPRDTQVAGVEVGGMSRSEAARTLTAAAGGLAAAPVPVTVTGAGEPVSATVDPAAAGLRLDVEATLEELTGSSWDPRVLWHHLVGGWDLQPETDVDRAALTEAVEGIAEQVDVAPVEGTITFTEGRAVAGEAAEGRSLDRERAADVVAERWPLPEGAEPVQLPAEVLRPRIDDAAVAEAMREVAEPAVSAPLVVAVGEREVVLPPEAFAPALSVQPVAGGGDGDTPATGAPPAGTSSGSGPGTTGTETTAAGTPGPARTATDELQLVVDGAALEAAVLAAAPEVEVPPRDATVELRDGAPVVVPAVEGRDVPPDVLADAALAALAAPERRAVVEAVPRPAERTTEEVEALGIREVISTFSTNLPANPPRTENIRIAAAAVDGTLVEPGEVFSLNDAVGERTPQRGYNRAPVISGGKLVDDYGGGVSQLATTIFNAVFFAGLEDVEHKPHSFYISRYPEGREATLDWRSIDLRFRNDSDHGVLIDTDVSGGKVTVTFWGTKVWDVEAVKGPRTNIRAPRTVYDESSSCSPQSPQTGFDVEVTRIATHVGTGEERRQTWRTRYNAANRIVCGPDPAEAPPAPAPAPEPGPAPAAPAPAAPAPQG